jgi:hypothetical protein
VRVSTAAKSDQFTNTSAGVRINAPVFGLAARFLFAAIINDPFSFF